MSDAHEVLSYVVTADDRATAVFRGIGAEITKLSGTASTGLRSIASDMAGISGKKPIELVKAEQAVAIAKTEAEMAKLNKTIAASGVATKLESAELGLLTQRHKDTQKAIDATALAEGRHTTAMKAASAASAGILAAGGGVIVGAIKQGIAWEDLTKKIQQETGLSGKSLKELMSDINNVSGTVPYKLNEVAQAAVLLSKKFGESSPEIEKNTGLMVAFAQRAEREVKPAVTGLLSVMQDYNTPLGHVVGLTDELVGVSQKTQKPMGELLGVIEQYGPKLQALGFGLHESIGLLGTFQESGIPTTMLGRGLSQALTTADKQLGVSASNPSGNPQEALQKEELALEKARATAEKYNETIPRTAAQENQLARERQIANQQLAIQEQKYGSLKKSIEQNGGALATTRSVVRGFITDIEHASSKQQAFNIGEADFGKQAGPTMARAFYDNKAAIEAVDQAQKQHGLTAKLVKVEEGTLEGQIILTTEAWHKAERTLSGDLTPAVGEFLQLTRDGITDLAKLSQDHPELMKILGGGAMAGAASYLVGAHTNVGKAAVSGVSSIFSKITGIGGAASSVADGIHGYSGNTALAGSRMNPIATINVSTGGSPIAGKAEEDAKDAKGAITKDAEKVGGGALLTGATTTAVAAAGVAAAAAYGYEVYKNRDTLANDATGALSMVKGGPSSLQDVEAVIPGSVAEANALRAKGGAGGRTELGGLSQSGAQKYVQNTREEVEANKLLLTSSDEIQAAEEQLAAMRQQGESHTAQYKHTLDDLASAEREHAKGIEALQASAASTSGAQRQQIEQQLSRQDAALAAHPSSSTRSQVLSNYKQLASGVQNEMASMSGAVGSGVSSINKQLKTELSSLIGKNATTNLGSSPAPTGPGAGFGPGVPVGATGRRVPGAVGPDNWTLLDPSGRPAAKVGGAELLVANRHTEADVDRMLAPYGTTLGAMVAGETTPHSAATGGRFIADPGTNFTVGKEPIIAGDLQRLAAKEGWTIYGISGYRTPQHSVEVGGFANDPHTRGEAADVGINSQALESAVVLNAAMLASVGLERPFYPADAHEINHVQLLGSLLHPGIGGVLSGGSASIVGGGSTLAALHAPTWKGPGGLLGQIGKATLAKVAAAATAKAAKFGGSGSMADAGPAGKLGPPNKTEFARYLAEYTGLSSQFLLAWINHEQGASTVEGGNNWLNVETGEPGGGSGPYGASAKWVERHTPKQAAMIESQWLRANLPQLLNARSAAEAVEILEHSGYAESHYGNQSPATFLSAAATGGRVDFAGAFGSGGSYTASRPTLALFGENGSETAHFVPHAATGERVGSSGLGEQQGVNPDNGEIEYHTQEEWQRIRLQHSSQTRKEALYKKAHPSSKPTYEDTVKFGGVASGVVTLPKAETINLGTEKEIQQLATSTWQKVVSAVQKALKATGDDRVALAITGAISSEHGARAHALATKSIEAAGATVTRNLKAAPEEEGQQAGAEAMAGLHKLMADATRSGNKQLLGSLNKDLETTFKTTASRAIKQAEAAPAGRATSADSGAVQQLTALAGKARTDGEHTMEQELLKDARKTVTNWHTAISTSFSKTQKATTTKEELKIAGATLDTIHKQGAGATLKASAQTDPDYLKEEEADAAKALKEYENERAVISKLMAIERTDIKRMQVKEREAAKKHHKAQAKALQAQIREAEAQLGEGGEQLAEVGTAIEETHLNVAELQAEYAKNVEAALKTTIDEADQVFESNLSRMQLSETLAEGELHRAGLDFAGLEEDKTKQEGVLNPTQIAQANADYAKYKAEHEEQIREDERQRAYDLAQLPGLSGEDRVSLEKTIEGLIASNNTLLNQIYDQGKATEKLTEATEQQTKVYGGTVGVNFNGQDYVVGGSNSMSSNSGANVGVGL
jgi:hypothetical protein